MTAPGPGYGAPPTGQFGPQHMSSKQPCGQRYQEGTSASVGPTCVAGCGRFAVGQCTSCWQPVCGLCSPGNGPLLCPDHRADAQAAAAERQAELEREQAATPAARAKRAVELAARQKAEFKEQMKASNWDFDPVSRRTIELLRKALPELRHRAADRAEPVIIMKGLGRTTQLRGWVLGEYTQESGNERNPGAPSALAYLVCDDGAVRVASRNNDRVLHVPKYRGALHLDTATTKGGTVHHDEEGLLLFGNTVAIRWSIREFLGEGKWPELVLADLGERAG